MKKRTFSGILHLLVAVAAVFLLALFTGCSKDDGKTLYLFNWTYYTPDSVIKQFEKEFGVKVKVDSYASNEEMYAKLKAGATGYDIVIPSQDYVSIMIKEGMLKEIDHSKLTNKGNISDLVLAKATYDPEMRYSVPYFMGAAGIAVNKDKVSNYSRNWSIFADQKLNQRMSMLDDMREVLGDALISLGYSVNTTNDSELSAAVELINKSWKPNLVKFDAEGFGKSFASGDFWVVQGYAEAVFGEVPESDWGKIDFFIPFHAGVSPFCEPAQKAYANDLQWAHRIKSHEPQAQQQHQIQHFEGLRKKSRASTGAHPHFRALLSHREKESPA